MRENRDILPGGQREGGGDCTNSSPPATSSDNTGDESLGVSVVAVGTNVMSLEYLDKQPNWREMWNPRLSMSLTNTKGLLNAPGQNNCFMNSAVQVLWHLDVFRRSFRMLSGHACAGTPCIFCALKVLFTQFQYSDQSSLPPDALRKALAKTFADRQRFQLGHMDDAAECFENILVQIHHHIANTEKEDMCNAKHCISHQKFAMNIVEQIVCQCGATSEPLPFTQMVHYVSANALVTQAKAAERQVPDRSCQDLFAQLVRNAASEGDMRNCPSNCGKKVQIRRNLTNAPDVLSVGMIWDTDRPSLEYIKDVMSTIGTTLRLNELFHSMSDGVKRGGAPKQPGPPHQLELVGVVCYYGKHYCTFFFHSKMNKWVYFDDATVRELGSHFSTVTDKCLRGHYQPLLLLYANPEAAPIDPQSAPQFVTKLPGYQNFNQQSPEGSGPQRVNTMKRSPNYVNYGQSLKEAAKQRRAITPNPEHESNRSEQVQTVRRRAITPGPENSWGAYDSDEEIKKKADIVHFRQPSYINAMDGSNDNQYNQSTQMTHTAVPPIGENERLMPHQQYPENQSSSYPHMNGYPQSDTHHAHQNMNQMHQHQMHPNQNQYGSQISQSTDYEDWTLSNHQQYRRPGPISPTKVGDQSQFVYPSSPKHKPTALAKVNEIQRIESFNKKTKGPRVGADVVRYQFAGEAGPQKLQSKKPEEDPYGPLEPKELKYRQYGSMVDLNNKDNNVQDSHRVVADRSMSVPESHPIVTEENQQAGNMKRTRSLENLVQEEEENVPHQHTGVSRTRTQSCRPYDYGNERPVVNQNKPNLPVKRPGSAFEPAMSSYSDCQQSQPMPSAQQKVQYQYGLPQQPPPQAGQALPEHQDMVDSKPPKPRQSAFRSISTDWQNSAVDEAQYGTYISRKTVEKLMSMQKGRPQAGSNLRQQPAHSSNSSLESGSDHHGKGKQVYPEALKVEIPGDNVSLSSQKDSGYRSNSSAGDRNSASSTSSMNVDSVFLDTQRSQPPRDQYAPPPPADSYQKNPSLSASAHQMGYISSDSSLSSNHSSSTVKYNPKVAPQTTSQKPPLPAKTGIRHLIDRYDQKKTPSPEEEDPYDYLPGRPKPVPKPKPVQQHPRQQAYQQQQSQHQPQQYSHQQQQAYHQQQQHPQQQGYHQQQQQPQQQAYHQQQQQQQHPQQQGFHHQQHPQQQVYHQQQQQQHHPQQQGYKQQQHPQQQTYQQQQQQVYQQQPAHQYQQQQSHQQEKQHQQDQQQQQQQIRQQQGHHHQQQQVHQQKQQVYQQQQQQVQSQKYYHPVNRQQQQQQQQQQHLKMNPDMEAESLCIKAEDLVEQSTQKEQSGDLAASLALCNKSIGYIQQALNITQANQETKVYARMKHNTCVLRSRSLHRRLMMKSEGDDTNSSSSEMDVKDAHRGYQQQQQGAPQNYRHQHQGAPRVHQDVVDGRPPGGIPPHLDHLHKEQIYSAQYSSDSGYSSHSDYAATDNLKGLPHSHTDGAISEHSKQSRLCRRSDSGYHERTSSTESKHLEIYATLPKKGQKPIRTNMPGGSRDNEIYRDYLQTQKSANRQIAVDGNQQDSHYQQQQEHNPQYGQYPQQSSHDQYYAQQNNVAYYGNQPVAHGNNPANHQRQQSNSKMSKQEIRDILINDFMSKGKNKQEEKKNPEHQRIRNLLYSELKPQMENLNIEAQRSGTKADPHGYQYPEDKVSYPGEWDQRLGHAQSVTVHHSRDSSSSSSHTLKAHSRENSLDRLDGQQPDYSTHLQQNYHQYQGHNQQHYGYNQQYPSSHHPNVTDRKIHVPDSHTPLKPFPGDQTDIQPPKPSIIEKLDKMHHKNLETMFGGQQNWAPPVKEKRWGPGGRVPHPQMKKSASHGNLHTYGTGQDDWSTQLVGDVVSQRSETSAHQEVALEAEEEWPPPPDELLYPPPDCQEATFTPQTPPSARKVPPPPPLRKTSVLTSPQKNNSNLPKNEETVAIKVEPLSGHNGKAHHGNSQKNEPLKLSTFAPLDQQPEKKPIIAEKPVPQTEIHIQSGIKHKNMIPPDNISISSSEQSMVCSLSSTGCSSMTSSDSGLPNIFTPRKTPKSVLKKKKKGKRGSDVNKLKKSVSFSDNIALIASMEDTEPDEIDFVAYVEALTKGEAPLAIKETKDDLDLINKKNEANLAKTASADDPKTGYDSDFDDDTDDSASDSTETSRCGLCQKRIVESTEMYCCDCQYYMSRLQPQASS